MNASISYSSSNTANSAAPNSATTSLRPAVTSAVEFSNLARQLAGDCRRLGLTAPGFRSPPRLAGRSRTVRRYADGSLLVCVVIHGRSPEDVLADMVEGIVVANGLQDKEAICARAALVEQPRPSLPRAA